MCNVPHWRENAWIGNLLWSHSRDKEGVIVERIFSHFSSKAHVIKIIVTGDDQKHYGIIKIWEQTSNKSALGTLRKQSDQI